MLLLAMVACSTPPEAPAELDALIGYLFSHAMDEDPAALQVGATNLDAWMDARLDETLEGYAVNVLDEATLDGLDDSDRSAEGLVGAAVGHVSPYNALDLVATVLVTPPTERDPETTIAHESDLDIAERDCFLSRECGSLQYTSQATDNFALGLQVTSTNNVQYRWFDTADGETALIQRTWLAEQPQVNFDWLEVVAQYYVWVSLPFEGGTRNMYAMWALTRITGNDVPEDLALSLAIDGMAGGGDRLDAWIDEHPPSW